MFIEADKKKKASNHLFNGAILFCIIGGSLLASFGISRAYGIERKKTTTIEALEKKVNEQEKALIAYGNGMIEWNNTVTDYIVELEARITAHDKALTLMNADGLTVQ